MVDWKLYIDSPQKRALDLCFGSLTEGDGYGDGDGDGYGDCGGYDDWRSGLVQRVDGAGCGYGWYGYYHGDGGSENEW